MFRFVFKPEVHYLTDNSSELSSIQNLTNPVHLIKSYFLNINFNFVFPLFLPLSGGLFLPNFSTKTLYVFTYSPPHTCHKNFSSHPHLFDHVNGSGGENKWQRPSLRAPPLFCHSHPLKAHITLETSQSLRIRLLLTLINFAYHTFHTLISPVHRTNVTQFLALGISPLIP